MANVLQRFSFSLGLLFLLPTLNGCGAARTASRNSYVQGIVVGTVVVVFDKTASALMKKNCPKNVVCQDANRHPTPGYNWVNPTDPNDLEVKWSPGITHPDHSHVIAAAINTLWEPEPGYKWNSGDRQSPTRKDLENLEVVWVPGTEHSQFEHVVADQIEGSWKAETGYVLAEPASKQDLRVKIDCSSLRWFFDRSLAHKLICNRTSSVESPRLGQHSSP